MAFADPCPACEAHEFVPAIPLGAAEVWRCTRCGLGRTVPPPAESDGQERFSGDPGYFARAYAEPKDRWWHRFNEAPLELLETVGARPGFRLLDVGCNYGCLVAAANRRGYIATGFDSSAAAVAFGRQALGLDLLHARIETAHVPPASQDIVVLNHVLEHLPEPRRTLARVREWLRPGGFLLIGLPNFASPVARWTGARWAGLVPAQHMWHFTPIALARLVTDSGFVQVGWRTRMLKYTPRGAAGWLKWVARCLLERCHRADNLLLVARRGAEGTTSPRVDAARASGEPR